MMTPTPLPNLNLKGGDAAPSSAAADLFSDVTTTFKSGDIAIGSATGGVAFAAIGAIVFLLLGVSWLKKTR